jgi:hypothetical protein
VNVRILFAVNLKHSSLWPSADGDPVSNDLLHSMPWQCIFFLSISISAIYNYVFGLNPVIGALLLWPSCLCTPAIVVLPCCHAVLPCYATLLYCLALLPCFTALLYCLALLPCFTALLYCLALLPIELSCYAALLCCLDMLP